MLPILIALSLSFPIATSPDIPVSAPIFGRAPFSQTNPRIASGGSVVLAAWNDARSGSGDVIATRVAVDGSALDETGIVIRQNATLDDLFWDGASFVILTESDLQHELAFVRVDGVIEKRISLDVSLRYAAQTNDGAATRLLFLPHDGYSPNATVLDLDGNVIRRGTEDSGGTAFLAASNGSGFLVLRWFGSFVAETLDRDGNVLASKDPGLPPRFAPSALAGDGNGGYVLFGSIDSTLTTVRLRADGTAAEPPVPLQGPNPLETGAVDPDDDLILTSYDDPATSTGIDVFVQKGTAQPQPLTESATVQTNPAIGAGANGFLASWSENSGTGMRIYARCFSADGQPQEPPKTVDAAATPVEVAGFPASSIVSSGDTYLVAWNGASARRMNARSGEWIDASPFTLRMLAMASNGEDALALTFEACGNSSCLAARHVAMSGEPLLYDPVPFPGVTLGSKPAIASNGHDYLAVWSENACSSCPTSRSQIFAMRLGADGSHLDAAPIALTPPGGFVGSPSVSWNGTTYLVTWVENELDGAYISSEGVVQPLGTLGDGLEAIADGGDFMILRRRIVGRGDVWEGRMLSGADWTPIVSRPNLAFAPPAAATNGAYLMFAFDRIDEPAGHVGRVFLDPRVVPSRKRAVR